jgi:hypothetical protein
MKFAKVLFPLCCGRGFAEKRVLFQANFGRCRYAARERPGRGKELRNINSPQGTKKIDKAYGCR